MIWCVRYFLCSTVNEGGEFVTPHTMLHESSHELMCSFRSPWSRVRRPKKHQGVMMGPRAFLTGNMYLRNEHIVDQASQTTAVPPHPIAHP